MTTFAPAAKFIGGAQAITRRATSSPRRLLAIARLVPESRSRSSSRAIDARTVESVIISVSTAADAVATAASAETAGFSRAEFAAAY
jgi:hypothetical protein